MSEAAPAPAADPPALTEASFGVAVHDCDLRYTFVNRALAEINGCPADRHLGKRPDELFDSVEDPITAVLESVVRTRRERQLLVGGSTAAAVPGVWACRYLPTSREFGPGDAEVTAVVQPVSDDVPGLVPARLSFTH